MTDLFSDIVVVEQPDGTRLSSPIHVFIRSLPKPDYLKIKINGQKTECRMQIGPYGEGFFIPERIEDVELVPPPEETGYKPIEGDLKWSWGSCLTRIAHLDPGEFEASQVEMSLCGDVSETTDNLEETFRQEQVSYETFALDPWGVLNDKRLMVKFESQLYRWRDACPLLLSLLLYNRPFQDVFEEPSGNYEKSAYLPQSVVNNAPLQVGQNSVDISSENTKMKLNAYYFAHNDKIVVSEFYPQGDMQNIYDALTSLGYKILLLTQNRPQGVSLPCLTHPRAFLGRANDPHLSKDEVLKSVREQFPSECQPFSIGLGIQESDAVCYRMAGIKLNRIFIKEVGQQDFYYYDRKYQKVRITAEDIIVLIS